MIKKSEMGCILNRKISIVYAKKVFDTTIPSSPIETKINLKYDRYRQTSLSLPLTFFYFVIVKKKKNILVSPLL